MLHPRNHVQADKVVGLMQANVCRDTVVIVDRAHSWNPRITPGVIQNELTTARFERSQIRIRGIHNSRGFLFRSLNRSFRTYLPVVPSGVAENHAAEVI